MEATLPMLHFLLQHTLRSLCSCSHSSPNSPKWVYAVFWRVLPRNYPPPKWEYGGGALDRSKGNKRNWILVWEDGFCDLFECERARGGGYMKGRFGADVFFKLSHEVYNYGEGLVGKVAADNSHRWVFKEPPNENDPSFTPQWNVALEPPPRAWELQFNSGIQTIAIISVREGIIQLGSFYKMVEDLNLVISIQRKLSNLQSIPGVFAIQRPYMPLQHPYILKPNNHIIQSHETKYSVDAKHQLIGSKRFLSESDGDEDAPLKLKSINMGWNSPQDGAPCSIPYRLPPAMSCSLGALLSKLPCVIPSHSHSTNMSDTSNGVKVDGGKMVSVKVKVEPSSQSDAALEDKPLSTSINP